MALASIQNKIIASFGQLYNHSSEKHIREFFSELKIPAFLDQNGEIKLANSALSEIFTKEYIQKKIPHHQEFIYKGKFYKKIEISCHASIKIYGIIETQLFDVPYNLIPHVLISDDGTIIDANKAFVSLLEITGTSRLLPLTEYLEENNSQTVKTHLKKQKKRTNSSMEVKFTNHDGTCALAYFLPVPNEPMHHCYFIDITEYKNIEMNLIHSQKMQAIGQLSGGIAHDFNNLLTAMLGFCDLLLLKHPAGDPSFAEIMQIKQNANRAANLVRQLLALSRKQVLKPKILDVTDIIAELANLIRRLIGENITLNLCYDKDLNHVRVDQGQLEQVIINLAVNARDAIISSGKKGTITISTRNVAIKSGEKISKDFISPTPHEKILPGRYVIIEVADNGTGISKKIRDKIFEPFFSTKEIGAGTGLGLSTVYGIINQIGGHIYIESHEGKGSKFYIYLKSLTQDQEATTMKETETKLIQKDLTGNATILLVEDEAPVRMFTTHALTNKGYTVIEASNGNEALAAIKEHGIKIDLIISDVMMPGMNGPSLISEIQKNYPKIKVIFISGYSEEAFSDTYNVDSHEDFHFLPKPFTLQQLVTKVKSLLEEKVTI